MVFGCILENTIKTHFLLVAHIFSHFLTFSQLPNKHIMSFIPKNSNKTQKDSIFSQWDRDRRDRDRNLADLDREIAIARDRDRNLTDFDDCDRRRLARSRSWSTSIGAIPVTGEIAIVVRRGGWFWRSEGLTEQCMCERFVRVREVPEINWSENKDWNQFQSF